MHLVRDAAGLKPFHGCILVPTMGALHEGHGALIRRARQIAERGNARVVVSLFVNPTQFNEARDFQSYPRDEERDASLCAQWGADAIFAPAVETMYPHGTEAPGAIVLPAVATEPGLEDAHRPGHFAGVVRVCRRLFDLVRPSVAVFGEKDWQQLQVIRAVVAGDGRAMSIEACATVREADGVAMSSRNARLSAAERDRARAICRALEAAGAESDLASAERAGRAVLEAADLEVEYLAVRDAETLGPVRPGRPARVVAACRTASTRLIDNAPWPGWHPAHG